MNSDLREDVWKIFQEFLENKGAVESYNRQANIYVKDHFIGSWVDGAFAWHSTPEGHRYWSDIHKEWENIVTEVDGIE